MPVCAASCMQSEHGSRNLIFTCICIYEEHQCMQAKSPMFHCCLAVSARYSWSAPSPTCTIGLLPIRVGFAFQNAPAVRVADSAAAPVLVGQGFKLVSKSAKACCHETLFRRWRKPPSPFATSNTQFQLCGGKIRSFHTARQKGLMRCIIWAHTPALWHSSGPDVQIFTITVQKPSRAHVMYGNFMHLFPMFAGLLHVF